MSATPQTRPGGRSARIRAAVHEAVEALVAEGGAEAATVPAVAERAGVHPTTVYRRWGTAQELVASVAVARLSEGVVTPDTGSLRDDLVRLVDEVTVDIGDPETLALMRAGLATPPEPGERHGCLAFRWEQLATITGRARDRGERTPGDEALADALLAPVLFRALFDGRTARPAGWSAALVDAALDAPGLLARAAAG